MGMRMQRLASFLAVMLMWAVLPGCGGGGGGEVSPSPAAPPAPSAVGSVSGKLNVEGVVGSSQARLAAASNESAKSLPTEGDVEPDFVPGKIIVRFKPEISEADAIARLVRVYADVKLENRGLRYPGGSSYIFTTDAYKNEQLSRKEAQAHTLSVLERLKADPAVRYTELNTIAHAQTVPTDSFFDAGFQWNLRAIGLPTAWELTKGSPEVVVAVLDTGIRADHPELAPLLLPGYDFVSDPISAGDLDGIDPNPTDPLRPGASFHGTHVAGTIAAASNNGKGLAGVAWNVRLMPIRVLGSQGGDPDDIIDGMLYAAGLPNRSNTIPTRSAQVINMSLTAKSTLCGDTDYQNVIDMIRAKGISIVVAAGNHAEFDPSTGLTNPTTSPASCRGVIAVGAVTSQLKPASYSTHHPYVFIAAPGGDISRSPFEGILSTMKVSESNVPQYQFFQGTSMAAPHVAGVIALMRSVNPSLTPAAIEQILKETAIDDSDLPGKDDFYGYGLLRADLAVGRAASTLVPRMPIPYPQPVIVIFDSATGTEDVKINNVGFPPLDLSTVTVETDGSGSWLTAQLLDSKTLRVSVDGRGLAPQLYTGAIGVNVNDGSNVPLIVPVAMRLPSQGLPNVGPITVFLSGRDSATGQSVLRTTTTDRTQGFAYSFSAVAPGQYEVFAVKDKDENDGDWGSHPDDLQGQFPFIGGLEPITVEAGKETRNIDFQIIKGRTIFTTDK